MRALLPLALLGLTAAAPPALGTLVVQVANVRNANGHVRLDLCPEKQFLGSHCPYSGEAPAQAGVTNVVVHNVPAGRYAVQAYHDENDNHDADRGIFGIPKEGVGFSNDARITFGPPKFAAAVFAFNGGDETIRLSMRYFLGKPGPGGAR